jgi:hypothetical protein
MALSNRERVQGRVKKEQESYGLVAREALPRVRGALGRSLTSAEQTYIIGQSKRINLSNYREPHQFAELITQLIPLLVSDLKDPKKISPVLVESHGVDVKELLKSEMKRERDPLDPLGHRDDQEDPRVLERIPKVNLEAILGTRDPMRLRRALNPASCVAKAYVVLDRRYSARLTDDNSKFTWSLAPQGAGYDHSTTISTTALLRNIVGIEVMPFRLPRAENAIISSNRISLAVEELRTQSFIANEEHRRFHCLFKITQPTPVAQYDIRTELSSLTLTFGNPFCPLTFDPDQLPATVAPNAIQTLLTFSQPHFMTVGDYVILSGVATDQGGVDSVEMDLLNDADGWAVSALTATTLTLDVDLSGLMGAIVNNPYTIYLESKRFVVPMVIKYLT